MNFTYKHGLSVRGETKYVEQDLSFDFVADNRDKSLVSVPSASLIVGRTLQAKFSISDGRLLYVWGYAPRESWHVESGSLTFTSFVGQVFVQNLDDPAEPGVGYESSLHDGDVRYYSSSGHFAIGDPAEADVLVEIASGVVIGVKQDQLQCIVLKPLPMTK